METVKQYVGHQMWRNKVDQKGWQCRGCHLRTDNLTVVAAHVVAQQFTVQS